MAQSRVCGGSKDSEHCNESLKRLSSSNLVGEDVGPNVGEPLGIRVVGAFEGSTVGDAVGREIVGWAVGSVVGSVVGVDVVGDWVGEVDGDCVGEHVTPQQLPAHSTM